MFDCTEGSSSSQLGVTKVFSIFFYARHPISSYLSSHFVFFIAHFKPQYCDTTRGFLLVLARMQWSDKIIQNSSNSHKVTCKVTCTILIQTIQLSIERYQGCLLSGGLHGHSPLLGFSAWPGVQDLVISVTNVQICPNWVQTHWIMTGCCWLGIVHILYSIQQPCVPRLHWGWIPHGQELEWHFSLALVGRHWIRTLPRSLQRGSLLNKEERRRTQLVYASVLAHLYSAGGLDHNISPQHRRDRISIDKQWHVHKSYT